MATELMSPSTWRENFCDLEELVKEVNGSLRFARVAEGAACLDVDDIEEEFGHIPQAVREAFVGHAAGHGWVAEFRREGGGPEILILAPKPE